MGIGVAAFLDKSGTGPSKQLSTRGGLHGGSCRRPPRPICNRQKTRVSFLSPSFSGRQLIAPDAFDTTTELPTLTPLVQPSPATAH